MGLVDRDDGWRLPDWLWARIQPLLPEPPAHPLGGHRPRVPDRDAMDAILLVLRTGMQWNALNATGICLSSAAHRRFQEWVEAGVFHEIWRQGLVSDPGPGDPRVALGEEDWVRSGVGQARGGSARLDARSTRGRPGLLPRRDARHRRCDASTTSGESFGPLTTTHVR